MKPWNFANLVSLKWHFLHFDIIFVVFHKVFIHITDMFGLFFAVVNPSFHKQGDFVYFFYTIATSKNHSNFMSTRNKCIQWGATLEWALLHSLFSSQHSNTFWWEIVPLCNCPRVKRVLIIITCTMWLFKSMPERRLPGVHFALMFSRKLVAFVSD